MKNISSVHQSPTEFFFFFFGPLCQGSVSFLGGDAGVSGRPTLGRRESGETSPFTPTTRRVGSA